MRAAVVGHVEWVTFLRVERLPAAGEIVHSLEDFEEAGGGGAVGAVQLGRLAAGCTFFTALGDDALGRRAFARLSELGVDLQVVWRREPTRRAIVHVDDAGERSITVVGERLVPRGEDPLPWNQLAATDAVYFTGGDTEAAALARAAELMVATPRAYDALAMVDPDVLVWSGGDPDESHWSRGVRAPVRVRTAGAEGGTWERWATPDARDPADLIDRGEWRAVDPVAPTVDSYGCGDSFAAALTFALGAGRPLEDAVAEGARCGAACLTGRGPYGARL